MITDKYNFTYATDAPELITKYYKGEDGLYNLEIKYKTDSVQLMSLTMPKIFWTQLQGIIMEMLEQE